jgi:MFS family permease
LLWIARAAWLAAAVLAATCALAGVLFGEVIERFMSDSVGPAMFATIGLVGFGYASAGLLILRHRPRHVVGWLLLAAGLTLSGEFASLAAGAQLAFDGSPLGGWLLGLSAIGFWLPVMLAGPVIALVFPDGRLPSSRWRRPVIVATALLIGSLVMLAFRPGPVSVELGSYTPANPLGVEALPEELFGPVDAIGTLAIPISLLAAISAVVVRFRRSRGDERQQLKWFTAAATLWGMLVVGGLLLPLPEEYLLLAFACLLLLPLSILIAISRYRLYEIDGLVSRALVYVPLVGIVAGFYAASVALFQRLFVAFTGNTSDAAAIISALLLAAVFTPVRKWLEGIVDRRFKPLPATAPAAAGLPGSWDDPAFEQAIEAVVRRVLDERGSTESAHSADPTDSAAATPRRSRRSRASRQP